MDDKKFLERAIELASESVKQGGFPAGALIVKDGEIVSEAVSVGYKNNDPSGHAESVAIREACKKLGTNDLRGSVMYESMQSCVMCFSTAYWANLTKIVYAARKTRGMVNKHYYEGLTDVDEINRENNRQIDMVHIADMEEKALEVAGEWESNGGFNS